MFIQKYQKIMSVLLCSFVLLFGMQAASTQGLKNAGQNLNAIGQKAGANTNTNLPTIIGGIINAALTLVGLIFLILMVYAGYLWMTARGEADQIDKAKQIIIAAVIGIVIVVSAYAITTFVTSRFKDL